MVRMGLKETGETGKTEFATVADVEYLLDLIEEERRVRQEGEGDGNQYKN